MGVLALYNRISSIEKLDEATTLFEVKDIVDEAVAKSEKGGFKKRSAYLHPNVMDKAIEKYCRKKILRNSERGKDYGESYG